CRLLITDGSVKLGQLFSRCSIGRPGALHAGHVLGEIQYWFAESWYVRYVLSGLVRFCRLFCLWSIRRALGLPPGHLLGEIQYWLAESWYVRYVLSRLGTVENQGLAEVTRNAGRAAIRQSPAVLLGRFCGFFKDL